jgi:hypothetical protein
VKEKPLFDVELLVLEFNGVKLPKGDVFVFSSSVVPDCLSK